MGMNQMDMNQMDMNQIGMNQMGMNQMGMNQMGMNQMGMNQMGMNQNQDQNFNNNFESSQNKLNANNSEELSVKFLKFQEGYTTTIVNCKYSEKVNDLINNYRKKTGDYDLTEKFVFNTKNLCPDLTVAEQGLINGAQIKIIVTKGVRGGL